jgi:hypothetical protein
MKNKKPPLIALKAGKLSDPKTRVYVNSWVSDPAFGNRAYCFSNANRDLELENILEELNIITKEDAIVPVKNFKFASEEKRLVVTPILEPDKLIARVAGTDVPEYNLLKGDTYYVTFSKEDIFEIMKKFMKYSNINAGDIEHDSSRKVNQILVESWAIESAMDKAITMYGFSDKKPGTWMGMFYIEDDAVWNDLKSGALVGISVEGIFNEEMIK